MGLDWFDEAVCRKLPTAMFFDVTGTVYGRPTAASRLRRWYAKQACAACPVAQKCLEYAQRSGTDYGVFGGLDQKERALLRSASPASAGLIELAERLRLDGMRWTEVARRLGSTYEHLIGLRHAYGVSSNARFALREYAAWATVAHGASPVTVSWKHQLPLDRAEILCAAMDKHPYYQGAKGAERHDGRTESVAC